MDGDTCNQWFCYFLLDPKESRLFGFPEFLAALALMVLSWTIADYRYRFRVRTSPFVALPNATFYAMSACGVLTLATDLWRAEGWAVPEGGMLTSLQWQAVLGSLFLVTFLAWAWFGLIKPTKFGTWNAERFAKQVYGGILRSHPVEIIELADELTRSAGSLVRSSYTVAEVRAYNETGGDWNPKWWQFLKRHQMTHRRFAYDILLMLADRKFCRAVVENSPATALAVFAQMAKQKKYRIPVDTFARNLTCEAISSKNSFAYHEVSGSYSGFFGYYKPITQALYGNIDLVEGLEDVFDIQYDDRERWTASEWEAYFRLLGVTFKAYAKGRRDSDPPAFLRTALRGAEQASIVLRWRAWDDPAVLQSDPVKRYQAATAFLDRCMRRLDEEGWEAPAKDYWMMSKRRAESVHDVLARTLYEVAFDAACVRSPRAVCWEVQYGMLWGKFFGAIHESPTFGAVRERALRLFWDDVKEMSTFHNFKGARVLGLSLNVLGLRPQESLPPVLRAYHRLVLAWTRRNYVKMATDSPGVAAACLVEGMSYDAKGRRLVRTIPGLMGRPAKKVMFDLDP